MDSPGGFRDSRDDWDFRDCYDFRDNDDFSDGDTCLASELESRP